MNHSVGLPEGGTLNLADWFTPNGAQIAWGCNGRVQANNGLSIYSTGTNTSNPYNYAYYINIVNTNTITSIKFTEGSVNEGNFWAVSGSTNGTTYTPIPVSGFNQMCLVPAYTAPYPVNATMDDGTNISFTQSQGNGNTWFEQGFYPPDRAGGCPLPAQPSRACPIPPTIFRWVFTPTAPTTPSSLT